LNLILPLGISFYTFQSLSYTIDIYRGTLKPVDSYWRYLMFTSFFPQLVAGPIVRAKDFIYQIYRRRRVSFKVWGEGLYLIVYGFFMKMVVADHLGSIVDLYWNRGYDPNTNSSLSLCLALLFTGQIYADFSGYSNIARGLAYLLGFRLPVNFNNPYISTSFKEFWTRWHITLSQWLRDYLYLPLGGNRVSRTRTYINLMLVMLLGGLWHGAAFVFIFWGFIHGAALAIERLLGLHQSSENRNPLVSIAWAIAVQVTVILAWIFFRSDTVPHSFAFIGSIFSKNYHPLENPDVRYALVFLIPIVVVHLREWISQNIKISESYVLERAMVSGAMIYFVLTTYAKSNPSFIYFQF
jgi:D-alanyl-lipoteichoic acid acyltransferase DltB (MBOAT superfamily)